MLHAYGMDVGKLKKTLNEKCPECGHALQLRTKEEIYLAAGVDRIKVVEYIKCSVCDYECESKNEKKRKERFDKTEILIEPVTEDKRGGNGKYKERGGSKTVYRGNGKKSY